MRLRNFKETVKPTIEDTLQDVHPHTLEETFHWWAPPGSPCFVLCADENGNNRKWRKGTILGETFSLVMCPQGIFRTYHVAYTIKHKRVYTQITPGLQPELKPDTPEVRELLREAGHGIFT